MTSARCEWKDHVDRLVQCFPEGRGGLSSAAEAKVTEHLGACPSCQEEHAWLLAERRLFRGRARDRAPLPIPSFEAVFAKANPPRGPISAWVARITTNWRAATAQVLVVTATCFIIFAVVKQYDSTSARGEDRSTPQAAGGRHGSVFINRASGAGVTAMDREAACKLEEGADIAMPCMSVDTPNRDVDQVPNEPVSSFQTASFEPERNACAAVMCIPESM